MDIVRTEVITVKDITKNQYGDTVINGGIRISKSKQAMIDVFQLGAEVKVGFTKSAKGTEYPGTAEQTGKHSLVEEAKKLGMVETKGDVYPHDKITQPAPQVPQSKSTPVETEMSKDDWAEKDRITRKSIERQKALELAIESYAPMKPYALEEVLKTAKRFEQYLNTGE